MNRLTRSLSTSLSVILTMVLVILAYTPVSSAQTGGVTLSAAEQASEMLEGLTPEERVGQLFLITFEGTNVEAESQIANLITHYHIGGVILSAEKDNFTYDGQSGQETLGQVVALNRQLQLHEWYATRQSQANPSTGESFLPSYIPLFIGLSQEGDGYPYDQILHGLTPLPNAMALGATWKPDLAAQVGSILGQELSTLGFNLLLGPSLDVLETPQLEGDHDLGTRSFGGDPYWVGQMGRAFIRGVHTGSQNHMAVVAKHFPGHGSSDRLPEEEVATVRKSLEELESFDLAPFFVVTGQANAPEETADALLTSHIRYQGLQGNIRATTRPVSFDPQAFNLLMQIPSLDNWRQNGGVMISDNLGSQAVRHFYNLTSQAFDARRVSLNAFLAGNDLLYVADFSSDSEPDADTAAIHTLEFFAKKYREDAAFAQRVDESALRILTLKYRLFQYFTLGRVAPNSEAASQLSQNNPIPFDVARQAATLISPIQAELDETLPDPPNQNDRMVFLSDTRTATQCSQCPSYLLLGTTALQEAILRLYGPQAGGQVAPSNLSSYSLSDLEAMLNDADSPLETDLQRANWIVFAMLAADSELPSFHTLSRFLTERPDLFQQKRLVVFAFCAPYYLDATNTSKLSAYYGLYSKSPQFIDVAAYLLLRELRPNGAPPVSITGIGYDLNEALFPNPAQTIPLQLDLPQPATSQPDLTPEPTPTPEYRVGDIIPLRTGPILDHNGNPVPDGTPVEFILTTSGESNIETRQSDITKNGVARTAFSIASPGSLEIVARSENARSNSLKFDIPAPSGEAATITPPTETPTTTPLPSPTETLLPTPTSEPTPPPPENETGAEFGDWLIAVMIAGLLAWATYRLAALVGQVRWGARAGFLALIGSLLAYCYLALEMPGSQALAEYSMTWSVVMVGLGGGLAGVLVTVLWRALASTEKPHSDTPE